VPWGKGFNMTQAAVWIPAAAPVTQHVPELPAQQPEAKRLRSSVLQPCTGTAATALQAAAVTQQQLAQLQAHTLQRQAQPWQPAPVPATLPLAHAPCRVTITRTAGETTAEAVAHKEGERAFVAPQWLLQDLIEHAQINQAMPCTSEALVGRQRVALCFGADTQVELEAGGRISEQLVKQGVYDARVIQVLSSCFQQLLAAPSICLARFCCYNPPCTLADCDIACTMLP
jgi:hypothetical protein